MDRPQLGDYRIEGIVGCGRTGDVYLATDRIMGRAVALKVLRDDLAVDPHYRERFKREGALLASLQHPHILPIYGMGATGGVLYMATRLVSGNLKSMICGAPLAVDRALEILSAVASAIDAAHAAGVVHRDVKPANVLIDPGPRAYLGDFGLARDLRGPMLTMPGQILGTLDYMAPEHLDGAAVGPPGDIYAFTCLAVEALTGEVAFPRDADVAVMMAHVREPAPSVSARRPELPPAVDGVIAAGMAKDPGDRPPTAAAVVADMLKALERPEPVRLAAAG
jgi:serine/threonine protein kinase